jgi:hypothetical protein
MFRKFLAPLFALVAAMLLATSASAAPMSGSFTVDLVFAPDCFSNVTSVWWGGTEPCDKVSDTVMKFEADLLLRLTISGLEIGSTTVFTFEGLEFQAITLGATIGALTIKDTFIFAPSIVELEAVRTSGTMSLRYCVNTQSPGDVTPPFLDCPSPDALLYFMIEDVGVFHPAFMNFYLAYVFDATGMLNNPVVFRKKIVDLALNIAGLTISSRALFANIGTAAVPSYAVGVIAAIEGQTVSGITVRAESWIGSRQGVECFAECKPVEIYRTGKVVHPGTVNAAGGFTIQEEKLFIRNLTLAGVTFNIRAEFQFFTQPGSICANPGICYVQVDTRARLQQLNLNFNNTLRLGPDLNPRFDFLFTSFKFGDVSVTAVWYFYLYTSNRWEATLAELISTFDPPGVTITSDLLICTDSSLLFTDCLSTNGVVEHDIYVSAAVGNFTFDARAIFFGLMSEFAELWIDLAFKAGNVDFTFGMVLAADYLQVARLTTSVKF